MMDSRSHLIRNLGMFGGFALCLVPAACWSGYTPGGYSASGTPSTYESTQHMPQTVTLVDTTTQETIWSMEVPVGQQLVVDFAEDHVKDNPARPALMKWRLMERGGSGSLSNSIPAPAPAARRLDVSRTRTSTPAPAPAPATP